MSIHSRTITRGEEHDRNTALNILLGVIAVNASLVTRENVLSAFTVWADDTSRSLGEILLANGSINDQCLTEAEDQVAEQLRLHDHDPALVLSTLSMFRSLRADLDRIEAPVLHSFLSLFPTDSTVPEDEKIGSTISNETRRDQRSGPQERFRVLRPYKRGGLGEVFVARDRELNRDVALKQIIEDLADDPGSRARFLLEAEITGGLEHPGIVPVYGLGTYGQGRPYYAMRFVKGDSLRDAVLRFHRGEPLDEVPATHRVELRKLLGRFMDVCDVVAYAHSRGILHRDIKPANILLGPYGETLLVDWGLAKVIGRGDDLSDSYATETTLRPPAAIGPDPTRPGSQIGTPAFMSPEQAVGAVDKLAVTTDIYSLGATLFFVLTGRPPFTGSTEAVLREVRAGNFPRPRMISPETPPGLEAICLKGTSTIPEDRYPSARAMAIDVERWMADEPISAMPEDIVKKVARWFRRHRRFAATALATMAVVTGVSLVATVMVSRALETEKASLASEFRARKAESVARAEAQQNLAVAESNFELASQAVENVLLVADGTLAAIPGREQQRRMLAETAMNSCSALLKNRPTDPGLRYLTARVERLVGNTNRSTGRFERARKVQTSAIGRLMDLANAFPAENRYHDRLAELEVEVSETLRLAGRAPLAEPHALSGLQAAERLRAGNPNRLEYLGTYALCLYTLAEVQLASGKQAESIRSFTAAIDLLESLKRGEHLTRPTIPLELAMVLFELGEAQRADGRIEASERSIRQSLAASENLGVASPKFANDIRFVRAGGQLALAHTLAEKPGHREETLRAFDMAVEGFSSLVNEFPWLAEYRKGQALALAGRARLRGATRESEVDLSLARTLVERLLADSNDAPAYDGLLGLILGDLGLITRDREEAKKLLNDAITHQKKALAPDANPESPSDKDGLLRHEKALANLGSPDAR